MSIIIDHLLVSTNNQAIMMLNSINQNYVQILDCFAAPKIKNQHHKCHNEGDTKQSRHLTNFDLLMEFMWTRFQNGVP